MKDWSGKHLCFECARKVGAHINIGRSFKERCHRCHSYQTLFKVTEVSASPLSGEEVCPECAHPVGTHAASCRRSELEVLRLEIRDIVRALEEFDAYDPQRSLGDLVREALRRAQTGH